MQLKSDFVQLPLSFDIQRLSEEVLQFTESDWSASLYRSTGSSILPLVAEQGVSPEGLLQPTEALSRCPYLQQVIASFDTVVGVSRLMRLDPESEIPSHYDASHQSHHHVRIHVPIVTALGMTFSSTAASNINMCAGDAWVFGSWKGCQAVNNAEVQAIHLVIHTTGTSTFWSMLERGRDPRCQFDAWQDTKTAIPYRRESLQDFPRERHSQTTVSSAEDIDNLLYDFLTDLESFRSNTPDAHDQLEHALRQFRQDWRSGWMQYRDTLEGVPYYLGLQKKLERTCDDLLGDALLGSSKSRAIDVLHRWLSSTVNADAVRQASSAPLHKNAAVDTSLFDSPVFIVAAPRSGSTMLFELLKENRELWTIGDESHRLFESMRQLNPANREYASNALSEMDLTDQIGMALFGAFKSRLRNSRGQMFSEIPLEAQASSLRVLEKTPKNALRIPFIRKLFPDARFIYLHREAHPNIGSIIDAWASGSFVTYPTLPGWSGSPWSLLLPQGWRELRGKPLAEIAAWQWASSNRKILDDLSALPDKHWHAVTYESLLSDREMTLRSLCEFVDVPFGPRMQALSRGELPHSKYTLEPPATDKWRRHQSDIERALLVRGEIQDVIDRIADLV